LLSHGNFGPRIVWNDSVTNFITPTYHMEKMLFADNAGTRVLPFTQNTAHCFWSASLDTATGRHDVLVKEVNNSNTAETVKVVLEGAGKISPVGHATTLTGTPQAENSLANPSRVVPVASVFPALGSFHYSFPSYSITVLRLTLLR
jgi:alpha-L-arabinofuranosidase